MARGVEYISHAWDKICFFKIFLQNVSKIGNPQTNEKETEINYQAMLTPVQLENIKFSHVEEFENMH